MCGRSPGLTSGRAIIGVIALYALLLQAVLGFAAPAPAGERAGAVLCAEHPAGAPADDKARADCHPCCTTVHVGTLASPPPVTAAAPWPRPGYARIAWRPGTDVLKTGPPVLSTSARGPPSA